MESVWLRMIRMPYEERVKELERFAEYVKHLCSKERLPSNCLGYDLDSTDEVADMLYDYCLELSRPACEQRLQDAVADISILVGKLRDLLRRGSSKEQLINYAYVWLTERDIPNAEKLARLVVTFMGQRGSRLTSIPVGVRMFIIVGKPTKWARPVEGEVEVGEVGGRKVYLIVPSLDSIERISSVRYNRARVTVRKGWIEEY